MKNKFLIEMQSRGYLNQCTDIEKLDDICNKKSILGYIGFDCTASSLHVGSLLQIMILKLMQKHGHQPIVLMGGGTTLIGDPSGKDSTRKILNQKEINTLIGKVQKEGLTLIPLSLYWNNNKVKLKLGVAKGKKKFDKRQSEKNKDWAIEKNRVAKTRLRSN